MSIENVKYIKVSPGMGTARVGNSDSYFIGPEAVGEVPNPGPGLLPDNSYKDANGLIKPQAARFRVYGYDEHDNVVMEITDDETSGISINWDVRVRNMKAANYAFQGKFAFDPSQFRNPGVQMGETDPNNRTSLIIDPGLKSITGTSQNGNKAIQLDGGSIFSGIGQANIPSSLLNPGEKGDTMVTYTEQAVSLGRLETDPSGRLIFIGGRGDAGCLIDPPVTIEKGVSYFGDQSKPLDKTQANKNLDPTSNGNSYFNNPGWYDDTCGGSINATVSYNPTSGDPKTWHTADDPKLRGWVAVSPPKFVPSMNNVVSLLDLQIDLFPEQDPVSGSLNFAVIDVDGLPNIATEDGSGSLSFAPISGVTHPGTSSPSITSFQGNYYYAYNSNGTNYLASSADGRSWSSAAVGSIDSNLAPSICAFNGNLTIGIVDSTGYIHLGRSTDGTTFTFLVITPGGGVLAPSTSIAPCIAGYNGQLYIAVTLSDGSIQLGVQDINPADGPQAQNIFTFYPIAAPEMSIGQVSICFFFGQLYMAFTGTNNVSYLGTYNNLTKPADAPVFDFSTITLTQNSTLPPAISASHGKLYYAVIGSDSHVYVASGKPGFTSLTFAQQGSVTSSFAPAVTNFNSITFYRDIYPILKTVTDYAWVNEPAFIGHAPGSIGDFLRGPALAGYENPDYTNNTYRRTVFSAIRPAEQLTPNVLPPPCDVSMSDLPTVIPVQSGRLMPHLYGEGGSNTENAFNVTNYPNQWLSLTPHQLWKFQEWVNGNFTAGSEVVPKSLDSYPLQDRPQQLDFSALEPTVGGGFHPGIELTYNLKFPGYFAAPFRLAKEITYRDQDNKVAIAGPITPGSVAGYMSIPWQGDFWSCNISWWAAMRPDIVVLADDRDPPKLTAITWFRGLAVGIPENSDSIDGYQGGYEHMARYWSDFGFVVPDTTKDPDQGMIIMQESERNPCLDNVDGPCPPVNPGAPQASIQLGVKQNPSDSKGSFPDTFYTNTIEFPVPASGPIYLSGTNQGTGNISVDDQCIISIDGTTIYSHDFSNGNSGTITPIPPVDLSSALNSYRGKTVRMKLDCVDLYAPDKSASNFWICFHQSPLPPPIPPVEPMAEVFEPDVQEPAAPKAKVDQPKQPKTEEQNENSGGFLSSLIRMISRLFKS